MAPRNRTLPFFLLLAFTCLTLAPAYSAWGDDEPAANADAAKDTETEPAADEPKADTEPKTDAEPKADAEPVTPAAAFEAVKKRWDSIDGELTLIRGRLPSLKPAEQQDSLRRYIVLTKEMHGLVPELQSTALAAYEAEPNKDPAIVKTLLGLIFYHLNVHVVSRDPRSMDNIPPSFDKAFEIGKVLHKNGVDVPGADGLIGTAAFYAGEEAIAGERLAKVENENLLTPEGKKAAREIKLRQAEAKKDDLPRVKLETSKGDVVIELFEDQAPGAVGNFVSLIEDGFYDGLTFHRVIEGFMAQGGDPDGTGTGGPGYEIFCECNKEDARMHFTGTLSMAHSGPNTGGSQFFITFAPTTHLDNRHTAFGRVIEGMENVNKLQIISPGNPDGPKADKIIKATVLRKRDHEYKPNKVGE